MSKIDELKQQIRKLENKLAIEEKKEKASNIECPFRCGDIYWWICRDGDVIESFWKDEPSEFDSFIFGNVFETEEEARFERDKRVFLIQFTNFRNKRNGDWKPFEHDTQFYLSFDTIVNVIKTNCVYTNNSFVLFGYFKNRTDCERAIELFGDEIKRLFVEE